MTRRASFSPGSWQQNLLVAISMGAAVLLVGCGGGGGGNPGGGGGGTGDCGDVIGSGATVVCGFVTGQAGAGGVNGVTVLLKNSAGTTVAQGTTAVSAGNNGFYKIVASGNPTQFSLNIPSGYLQDYLVYNNGTYDQSVPGKTVAACIPALNITAGQDNRINTIVIISDSAAPPPPVFPGASGSCPR